MGDRRGAPPQAGAADDGVVAPGGLALARDTGQRPRGSAQGGDGPVSARAVAGEMAKLLAARLEEHGYTVAFPPGRDPAVFRVTGLPASPYVEVTAEDNGQAACHYTGRTTTEAAEVIARLPVPGQPQDESAADTVTGDGIEIEWHYQPPAGQPAGPDEVAAAVLAHLAVLDGRDHRKDVPT
jgi:hypothetical protein